MRLFFFALPIFLAAFLLFQIQPLIAKYILPWFGGGSSVWTVSMFFFQTMLVLGYGYAYVSSRYLKPARQLMFFAVLLLVGLFFLSVIPDENFKPGFGDWPALRIFLLLAASIGLPYFILSAVSPLFQSWFSRIGSIPGAYRLYALSNFASLSALLSYPFLVEPIFGLKKQAFFWSVGFGVFVFFGLILILKLRKAAISAVNPQPYAGEKFLEQKAPGFGVKLLWFCLPACSTLFLLAVTGEITQNVPPVPFLWVLTLSFYLLSFVICFEKPEISSRSVFVYLFTFPLLFLALISHFDLLFSVFFKTALFSIALFGGCMVCHGKLAKIRPSKSEYLALFYLFIAAGGAFGGFFAGILAPLIFKIYLEFYLAVFLIAVFIAARSVKILIPMAALVCTLFIYAADVKNFFSNVMAVDRNFYGVLSVFKNDGGSADESLSLMNGDTLHGFQYQDEVKRKMPTAYFSEKSGIGLLMDFYAGRSNLKIGVVGLGIGTLAAYGKEGDLMRFYEINPQVKEAADNYFTYLSDSKAEIEVVLGDGRLLLQKELPQNYDIFILDAFSSDAIPIHLLTKEVVELYFRHLKPDGVIAFHISNNAFDLSPVVYKMAEYFDCKAVLIETGGGDEKSAFLSDWMIMSRNETIFENEKIKAAAFAPDDRRLKIGLWTDDYSNLFQVMRTGTEAESEIIQDYY